MSKNLTVSIPDFRHRDLIEYMNCYNYHNKSEVVAECIRIGLEQLNKEKKGEFNELHSAGNRSQVD